MSRPSGIDVIDTCIQLPVPDRATIFAATLPGLKDRRSKESRHVGDYMFKDRAPDLEPGQDPVAVALAEMDRHGVRTGVLETDDAESVRALSEHPDRFVGIVKLDPNDVMGAIDKLDRHHDELGVRAVTVFPAACFPQVPIDDRKMYPIYARCVALDLPIFVNAGVPGPRLPMAAQHVERIDGVMYDFPDLVFVTRHGCEPWEELAVKLMVKWPNLHYSTSAFAPKHYPRAVLDYANTRGADRLLYGGHYASGLTLERIFREMDDVPLRPHVWEPFLAANAARVLKLDR
jgi:predicted TIM-barrel fold metal-dependent hydrolase